MIYPSKNICPFCGRLGLEQNKDWCGQCDSFIEFKNREISYKEEPDLKVYYALIYNRFIREQIKRYKFHYQSYLYRVFASIMLESIEELKLGCGIDICFYVPSHRRKMATRGYNQAELLASEIARRLDLEISHKELIKIKRTKEQNKLDGSKRKDNLKGAYIYNSKRDLQGKKILLIDDLVTTGSTILETSRILLEEGAESISGLTLASSKKI